MSSPYPRSALERVQDIRKGVAGVGPFMFNKIDSKDVGYLFIVGIILLLFFVFSSRNKSNELNSGEGFARQVLDGCSKDGSKKFGDCVNDSLDYELAVLNRKINLSENQPVIVSGLLKDKLDKQLSDCDKSYNSTKLTICKLEYIKPFEDFVDELNNKLFNIREL